MAAVLLWSACAPSYGTAGLGAYDDFRPYVRLTGSSYEVELDRPAHIAIIGIRAPDPSRDTRFELTFVPLYPRTNADSTMFPAGKHRARPRPVIEPMRKLCGRDEIPTIEGCRLERSRGGTTRLDPMLGHYLVVVSESILDPYTLSFYLEEARVTSEELARALYYRDVKTAVDELTQAIATLPGSPYWAGYYVVQKR